MKSPPTTYIKANTALNFSSGMSWKKDDRTKMEDSRVTSTRKVNTPDARSKHAIHPTPYLGKR